ncbi:CU044_2847 family protein [Streptomyces sp. NPDC051211]|uniref:CU044_2847 family protein n=1 Tax=Streptomyces sp. NPDC051211 TaxID=3154643 RepID=UPI00344D3AE0
MAEETQLIRVPLEGGDHVVLEVGRAGSGIVRAARPGEIAGTAARTLTESFDQVAAAAAALLDRLAGLATPPSTVEVELGVKINAEAGAVIAKTAAEGNFAVRLTWERGAEPRTDSAPGVDSAGSVGSAGSEPGGDSAGSAVPGARASS